MLPGPPSRVSVCLRSPCTSARHSSAVNFRAKARGGACWQGRQRRECRARTGGGALCILQGLACLKQALDRSTASNRCSRSQDSLPRRRCSTSSRKVIDAASELLVQVSEKAACTRVGAIGVAELPRNACVEIEMIVRCDPDGGCSPRWRYHHEVQPGACGCRSLIWMRCRERAHISTR